MSKRTIEQWPANLFWYRQLAGSGPDGQAAVLFLIRVHKQVRDNLFAMK
jgi:hypothetical protein